MSQEKKTETPETSDLAKKLAETEKKLAALSFQLEAAAKRIELAEKEALSKVCGALGIDPESMPVDETNRPTDELVEYNIGPTEVAINGIKYTGRGRAPRSVAETVVGMAVGKREREMKARIGANYAVDTGYGGALSIRKLDEDMSMV